MSIAEALENRLLFFTTFLVTNTADGGAGSLRQAIVSANLATGATAIDFAIGTGPATISPASALPALTTAVSLDGTTQPGYAGTPIITIDGSGAGAGVYGIQVTSSGSTIRGLIIDHFNYGGLYLSGAGGDTVQGNYLGLTASGVAAAGNTGDGILVTSPNNLIGGPTASARNLLSGNGGHGINLYSSTATGNMIEGNFIGTDLTGNAAIPNMISGVGVYNANNNTIGGLAAGDGNVSSGNHDDGVVINGTATGNTVEGNLLGTNAAGLSSVANGLYGVEVDSPNNLVGGLTAAARNIISGNAQVGVCLFLAASTGNVIEGNYIGPDITGTRAVGTQANGVDITDGAANNLIGGTTPAAVNVISGNTDHGAGFFSSGTGNVVSGNFIGTTADGLSGLGNGLVLEGGKGAGVIADNNAEGNIIGGTTPGSRNLISANGTGIILFGASGTAQGNTAEGNVIGANAAGAVLANVSNGVLLLGDDNTIGGPVSADGNTIYGNSSIAISIGYGTGNVIQGNLISPTVAATPAVTLSTPSNGGASGKVPTFSGTATTSAGNFGFVNVTLYAGTAAGGTAIEALTATWNPANGNWSIPASAQLTNGGTYSALVSQSNSVGDVGFSTANTFTIDTTAPNVTLASPISGTSTNNNQPTFSGTAGTAAGDGSTIKVSIYSGSTAGGSLLETLTTSASAGSYSVIASPSLADGTYTAVASQSDAAGNIGTSAADTFTIDATAPTLTLTAPISGSSTNNNQPTFSGLAGVAPGDGSTITVSIYNGATLTGSSIQTLTTSSAGGESYSVSALTSLTDGTYTAIASQSDAAGNIGTSPADVFTVDTIAPTVTLIAPSNGSSTNNNVPTFSGAAGTAIGDGATITVSIYSGASANGALVQTLAGQASGGSYSVPASLPLTDGTFTAVASQSDAAGNTGTSTADTFTIDTASPAVTLTAPSAGSSTSSNEPVFSGAAGTASGDGASITVSIYAGGAANGALIQTLTTTAAGGTYSVTPTAALGDGTYTAVATQSDAAGNMGSSAADTFTIDTTAPVLTLTAPASGSTSNTSQPTFSGVAGTAPGDGSTITVAIYSGSAVGGAAVQTLTTSSNAGFYSIAASTALADGTYTAQASQSDAAGNIGQSTADTFTIAATVVIEPIVTLTAPASGSSTNNNEPTFGGTASTGQDDAYTVNINIYSGNSASGTAIQTLSTNWNPPIGNWSIPASAPLADGIYTAVASQSDDVGNIGFSTPETFTVDTTAPAVTLTSPSGGSTISNNETTLSGSAGTAPGDGPAIAVTIYSGAAAGGAVVATLTTNAVAGSFSTSVSSSLADGIYTAVASQTDSAGNTGTSASDTFTIDTTAPAITLTAPVNGSSTNQTLPTFAGAAGTASGDLSAITVSIYAGSTATGTAIQTLTTSASGGIYSVAATAALASGTYTAIASQTDSAGNIGTSAASTFTVDTVAPMVTLLAPASGTATNSTKPTFSGAAGTAAGDLPAITINIYSGSTVTGTPAVTLTATASGGTYSASPSTALTPGTYSAVADQSDAVGNLGASAPITFTIDTAAPIVTLTSPSNGSATGNSKPTFSGGAGTALGDLTAITIQIYTGQLAAGSPLQTVLATASGGTYSVATLTALPSGTYTVVAAQSDFAGNIGTSAASTFTVDTIAPTVTLTSPASGSTISSTSPIFAGSAGTAAGDLPTVTVKVFSANAATGTALETLTATASGGVFSVPASATLAPGSYTAVASQSDSVGNTGASTAVTFTIAKISTTVLVTDVGGVFKGLPFAATGSVTGGDGANLGTPTFTYYLSTDTNFLSPLPSAPSGVGSYAVVASFSANSTYAAGSRSTSFPISKATPAVVASAAGGSYTGKTFAASATVAGISGVAAASLENVAPSFLYYMGSAVGGTATATAPTTAGTYTVVASFGGSSDYGAISSKAVTFVIGRAASTIVATDIGGAFTGSAFAATAAITGVSGTAAATLENVGATFLYYTGSTVSGTATSTAPTMAGTYTVIASFAGSTDYLPAASKAVTFTITAPAIGQFIGTASANTTGSLNSLGNTYINAVDGDANTFFDAPTANGNWVQLDLGAAKSITKIAFAPRVASGGVNYEARMTGGVFEASNDPSFATGVVKLFTITTPPADGITAQAVSFTGTYRYVRYVSPAGSYGDIGEMQVFGPGGNLTTKVLTPLAGTSSANTTGSFSNSGNTFAKAFDGNVNSFFDAPSPNGNWVQLDLGSAFTLTELAFAPRTFSYESRMIGGVFEASNSATFASGVVPLYTVATQPTDGLVTRALSVSGTYRYIRYVSPSGSYGDIAEMQIFGTAGAAAAVVRSAAMPLSITNLGPGYSDMYLNTFDQKAGLLLDSPGDVRELGFIS